MNPIFDLVQSVRVTEARRAQALGFVRGWLAALKIDMKNILVMLPPKYIKDPAVGLVLQGLVSTANLSVVVDEKILKNENIEHVLILAETPTASREITVENRITDKYGNIEYEYGFSYIDSDGTLFKEEREGTKKVAVTILYETDPVWGLRRFLEWVEDITPIRSDKLEEALRNEVGFFFK